MSKKNNDDDEEDDFDQDDEWRDFWGDFKFFGDSKFFKNIFEGIMKDILPRMKNLGDISKFKPEDLMKNLMKNRDKFNLQGPFVYGFNVSIGPNGPKIDKFGNINPKLGKKEILKNYREPLTEVMEEGDNFIIVAEMPGIRKMDIELKATEYSLTISANSQINNRIYRKNINLPSAIDPDHAKARYQNGILEITLNKITSKEKNINIE